MARFREANLKYMQVELDFYAGKNKKKLVVATDKDEKKRAPTSKDPTYHAEVGPPSPPLSRRTRRWMMRGE
jgi:hypothetical protein